ncbi:MAG: hypothetical protein H0V29_05010 [Thermoleophilaceae bacterium]|nr:hypothetical protein [Thermoleophilaceae bacterium]
MKLLLILTALVAALAMPTSAMAAAFVVDDPVDGPGVGDPTDCDGGAPPGNCSLRDAIAAANASPEAANSITFQITALSLTAGPLLLTKPNTVIGQERNTTITWAAGAGPALTLEPTLTGTGSTLRRLVFVRTGGGAAGDPILRIQADGTFFDRGQLRNGPGDGAEVTSVAPATTDNVTFAGSTITGNARNGVRGATGARNLAITNTIFFGNGLKPISLEGAANAGAGAPVGLRVGPRQPDGSLPLSGTATTGGTIELYRGNPFSSASPTLGDSFGVGAGAFSRVPPFALAPGEPLATTLTTGGAGTSEFVLVSVPDDIVSPGLTSVRAINTTQLRMRLSEPIDPATVQAGNFSVEMASRPRAIRSVSVDGGGTEILITTAGGWLEGEAGYLQIGAPGSFADAAGNASLVAGRVRVAAGPGDFTPPRLSNVSVTPKKFCPSGVKRCRGPRGTKVTFTTNEEGRLELAAFKGRKQVGNRSFTKDKAGTYTIKFSGKLRAGRLSAGRYKLRFTMEDEVGNISPAATRTIRALGRKRR